LAMEHRAQVEQNSRTDLNHFCISDSRGTFLHQIKKLI